MFPWQMSKRKQGSKLISRVRKLNEAYIFLTYFLYFGLPPSSFHKAEGRLLSRTGLINELPPHFKKTRTEKAGKLDKVGKESWKHIYIV